MPFWTPAGGGKRLLLAHYMPWYQARPFSGTWGWHWTMNRFDPERAKTAASHYRPLIGLYDSGDPDVLQCQVMLMKLAGIDGVIFDWYGDEELYDYTAIHRNTLKMMPLLQSAGMRFALCYEDQTIPKLIEAGKFPAAEAVAHGQKLMRRIDQTFFSSPAYLRIEGRPVFLSFGIPYYNDAQWNDVFSVLARSPLYFTEHERRAQTAAAGAFDWPLPNGGTQKGLTAQADFFWRARSWPKAVGAAFPRFHDIYAEAGVHPSWGTIEDRDGKTFVETLTRSLQSNVPLIQVATWNDWGEGTQIEPSIEFGYRDLEVIQRLRRRYLDAAFPHTAADLRLPVDWYKQRKGPDGKNVASLFSLVASGRIDRARALLAGYKKK